MMPLPPWPTEAHRTPTGATDQVSKPFSPTGAAKKKHSRKPPNPAHSSISPASSRQGPGRDSRGHHLIAAAHREHEPVHLRHNLLPQGQRIGRSELYVPTALLKQTINQYARQFWPFIEALRRQS
jgi:hypothetical protein